MIRLVAIDIDGTLLNRRGELTPLTRAAVHETAGRGIAVVLATGRMYRSARHIIADLGLDFLPVICYNGAMIRQGLEGEEILHRPVPLTLARAVCARAAERGLYFQIYIEDHLYTPDLGSKASLYGLRVRVDPIPVGHRVKRPWAPPTKILVIAEPAEILAFKNDLSHEFPTELTLSRSFPEYLEVTAAGVDKGTALAWLAAWWGMAPEEILAAGDGGNDATMLRYAGMGVSIGNAALAGAADLVFPDDDRDGLAWALRQLVLEVPTMHPGRTPCATGRPFSWKDLTCRRRPEP